MKIKRIGLILFAAICLFVTGKVYAIDTLSFTTYNVSSACDLENDGGQVCFESFLAGNLDDKEITNGVVEKDEVIMAVLYFTPDATNSTIGNLQALVQTDPTQLEIFESTYGPEYGKLAKDLGYPDSSNYDNNYYTMYVNGRTKVKAWDASDATFVDDHRIQTLISSGDYNAPLTKAVPIYAFFYKVLDVTAGSDIKIGFSEDPADTAAADANADTVELDLQEKVLSMLSNTSTDGTLKTLTATGNNSLEYLGDDFVPSSKYDLEYSFVVPNNVTTITLAGEKNDPNATTVTGLTAHSLNEGNIFVTVLAESTDMTIYKLHVYRLSNDTSFKTFTTTNGVDLGTVAQINSNSGATKTIPYKTTSTDLTIATTHDNATATYDSTWDFSTDDTNNVKTTKTILVEAEDCNSAYSSVPGNDCTDKTYTFEITRTAPSKNVNLATLTVDGASVPGFDPSKTTYDLDDVLYTKTSLTIGATLADNKQTIVASGLGNKPISVGDNSYQVTVRGEDCDYDPAAICTTKTYTINVHQKSHESLLQTMSVTSSPQGNLSPAFVQTFDSASGEYTYTYDPNVTSITVSAVAKDTGKAYVSIIDMSSSEAVNNSVKTINSASQNFGISTTKVGVIVTAEDGSTRVYKVKLERQRSNNNYLSALSINPGTINETFSSTKGSYTATVEPNVEQTVVTATLADSNATLTSITGNTNFSFDTVNTITVTVTSESGNVNTYTINVTRKKYDIDTLSDLKVGVGTATPTTVTGFDPDVLEYTISTESSPIPYTTNKLTTAYTKGNDYESVTGDIGELTLQPGENTFEITVTSHDTANTKVYKIHAYRQKNTDNETKGVVVAGVTATVTADPQVYEVTLPNSVSSIAKSDVVITKSDDATISQPSEVMNLSTQSVNVYNYTITAANGDAQNYTINITREKSANANISRVNLYVGEETTSTRYCVMADSESSCKIEVPVGTTSYRLETIHDATATVDPADSTVYTMTSAISDSSQVRNIKVTAENEDTKDYAITVERAKSTNANLRSITVTDITDASNPEVISLPPSCTISGSLSQTCNLSVEPGVKVVKIEAETEDEKATIISGLQSALNLPFNTVRNEIKVEAENTTVDKTYTLNITRIMGYDTTLSDLQVEGTTVDSFDPDDTEYTYSNQAYLTTELVVKAKATDALAKVTKVTVTDKNGTEKNISITAANEVTATIPLTTEANTIKVTVTAHNGTDTDDYIINVNRTKNNDTGIKGITVNGIAATKDENDDTKYTVTVANNITEANSTNVVVDVNDGAKSYDAKATYTVPTLTLDTLKNDGTPVENTLIIPVTAEDGSIANYTVIITRTPSNVVTLNRVNLYVGEETTTTRYCVFTGNELACSIPVDVDTTGFTLEGLLQDPKSKVEFTSGTETNPFTMASTESTKVVTATVTAENGINTRDYTITVERAKSSNSYLKELTTNAASDSMNRVNDFGTTKTVYNITVPGTQSSLTVHAEAEDDKSKITSTYTTTETNEIDFTTDLNEPGQNTTVEFVVTAENGNSITYTLNVEREKNIEPRLASIAINGTDIDGFDPDVTEYTIDEPYGYLYNNISITATNVDATYGTRSGTGTVPLQTIYYDNHDSSNEYVNVITVRGIAQNTSIYQDYVINVKRSANSSTAVAKVEMLYNGTRHVATYNNGAYNITVPNSVTVANDTNVFVTVADPQVSTTDNYATYTQGSTDLVTNVANTHRFTVKAEDGTEKEYRLVITREKSNISTLDNIYIHDASGNDIGSWSPSFTKTNRNYTITLADGDTDFYVIPVKSEDKETISGIPADGKYTLEDSSIVINVTATSEDESSSTTYKLTVKRTANNNNNLGSITVSDLDGNYYTVSQSETDATHYQVTLPGKYDTAIVDVTPENPLSTVDYVGKNSGTVNQYTVPVGTVTKEIKIKSESGASQSYYLEITREPKDDNYLSDLLVDDVSIIDPDKDVNEFTLPDVDYNKTSVRITYVKSDTDATVTGDGYRSLSVGNNPLKVTVKAQNGTEREYIINITRKASTDARLVYLSVNGGTAFTFDGNDENNDAPLYETTVSNSKSVLTKDDVVARANDGNATIDKMESLTLSTTDENIYTLTVTAQDGVTTKTYNIKVNRPKSTDATLNEVQLFDTATLVPSLDLTGNTTEYTVLVPYGSTTFKLRGVANSADANVSGNREDDSFELSDSPVRLVVTAESGAMKVYTFNIEQAQSKDATLGNLYVMGYSMTPEFNSTTLTYNLEDIPLGTMGLNVQATPSNANARIKYKLGNVEQASNIVNLADTQTLGTYTITVEVTAADGVAKKSYSIEFNMVAAANNYLAKIVPSTSSLTPGFSKGVQEYSINVSNSTTSIDITTKTEDDNASVSIDNNEYFFTDTEDKVFTFTDLVVGNNYKTIYVKAGNNAVKSYRVNIIRQSELPSNENHLSALSVTSGDKEYQLTPEFNIDLTNYTIDEEIPYDLETLTINATKNHSLETIKYYVDLVEQSSNEVTVPVEKGTKQILVQVIAEDGTPRNYTITYTKNPSSNAELSNIADSTHKITYVKTQSTYEYNVSKDVDTITYQLTAEDPKTTITVGSQSAKGSLLFSKSGLVAGRNEITINTTAEDGTKLTYSIIINKEAESEIITSVEYGHTIADGMIKTVGLVTVGDLKNQLDNDNSKLEVWSEDDTTKLDDSANAATGQIVKLIINGEVVDSDRVVVKGDVNGDGRIKLSDSVAIINHYVEKNVITKTYFLEAADVDSSGSIKLSDSVKIINHYLGKTLIHN